MVSAWFYFGRSCYTFSAVDTSSAFPVRLISRLKLTEFLTIPHIFASDFVRTVAVGTHCRLLSFFSRFLPFFPIHNLFSIRHFYFTFIRVYNAHFYVYALMFYNRFIYIFFVVSSVLLLKFYEFWIGAVARLIFAVIRKCKFLRDHLNNLLCFYFNFYSKNNCLCCHIFTHLLMKYDLIAAMAWFFFWSRPNSTWNARIQIGWTWWVTIKEILTILFKRFCRSDFQIFIKKIKHDS